MPMKGHKYEKPTEGIYGSIKVEKPIDDPKSLASERIRKKRIEDLYRNNEDCVKM